MVVEEWEENRKAIFKGYIERSPVETDIEVTTGSKIKLKVPEGSNAVLVKNIYLSCDPYMRGRMRNFKSYIPSFVPGQPIEGYGVSKVIDSGDASFKEGDYVCGKTGWEDYSLVRDTEQLRKIDDHGLPLSYHVGVLGMPGFTAYAGLQEVCSPRQGDRVLVSAASGAVGQLVGQLAKLQGCYVVGSAGSAQKVHLLKDKLGFDDAFNYKDEPDLDVALKRYFPEGIDVYFDNVGGAMLDAALLNMRTHGRIAVCGMISQHALSDTYGIRNLYNLVFKQVKIQGFLQSAYLHLFPRFLEDVVTHIKGRKIVYIEDVRDGLDAAPAAFAGLFAGKNTGKLVIRVAVEEDPACCHASLILP